MSAVWALVFLVGLLALGVGMAAGALEDRHARQQGQDPALIPRPMRRKGRPNGSWLH